MVLKAGQRTDGFSCASLLRIFFDPQLGYLRRIASSAATISSDTAFGWLCGARLRPFSPSSPSARKRLISLWPLSRLTPYHRHNTATLATSACQSIIKLNFSSDTLALHGMAPSSPCLRMCQLCPRTDPSAMCPDRTRAPPSPAGRGANERLQPKHEHHRRVLGETLHLR